MYDGSAKNCKDEQSLNDCLEVGENYIPHIFEMLTRFRWNLVALTEDIEKAFLMVRIKSEETCYAFCGSKMRLPRSQKSMNIDLIA